MVPQKKIYRTVEAEHYVGWMPFIQLANQQHQSTQTHKLSMRTEGKLLLTL